MPITLRAATPEDAATIIEYNARLAHESEGKVLNRDVLTAGVNAVFTDAAKGFYTVAEIDGRVVGQCQVTYEWSDWRNGWYWWIQSVYVAAEARRQGVFRALYKHLETTASQREDVIGIRLYFEHDNETAKKTYLSLGMEQETYHMMARYPLPGRENSIGEASGDS